MPRSDRWLRLIVLLGIVSLPSAMIPIQGRLAEKSLSTHGFVKLHSIPAGLSVFVSTLDEPSTLFSDTNFKGKTPVQLQLKSGTYQAGYLMPFVTTPVHISVLHEVKTAKDLRLVATFQNGSLLHSVESITALTQDVRAEIANRFSLTAEEQEPYIWDLVDESQQGDREEFNRFYYKLQDKRIVQVGSIYRVQVGTDAVEHVGIILPERWLDAVKHFNELRTYYPSGRRFKLTQSPVEVDLTLRKSGILEHKAQLIELLERGGKVIYDGARPGGSIVLEKGVTMRMLNVDDISQVRLRDVLSVVNGTLKVRRYGSGLSH